MVSATLSVRNIIGGVGIEYRAGTDSIAVNVSSTSDVTIEGTPCTKQGTSMYICAVHDTAEEAIMTYYLENSEGDSATASIKVDNGINAINYVINNDMNRAVLDFNIQDSGFDNNNACSGIKTLKIYDKSTLLNTVNLNGAPGQCSYQGTINLTVSGSGVKSISLEVTDNVGNVKKTPEENITIDMTAPEIINGLTIKYSGTEENIGTISNSAAILVDMYFSIREDSLSSINMDLSGANNNPAVQYAYKNIQVPLSNCVTNTTGGKNVYNCRMNSIQLRMSGSTLTVGVTAKDVFGSTGTANLSKSFTIDNVQPKATIETDLCDSIGRCYIHSGVNKIVLSVNKQNFNRRRIFFTIPGSTFGTNMVQNCTSGKCTANISLTCDSGSQVEASIASYSGMESQDDAGNAVEPYSTYLYCDNSAPRIESINVTGESSSVIKEIASGSKLTITVNVSEPESDELNAYAMLDKLKNATEKGTCTKKDIGKFECVWTVSSINAGYYDAVIMINISDVAGNMNSKEYKQKVFGFKSDNLTPDNLGISFRSVSPEEINRIVVDMATANGIPYYVYAKYNLRVEHGTNVAVLHQTVDLSKCIYMSDMGTVAASTVFGEAKLNNVYAGLEETGRIDFKFNDNTLPNLFSDEFTIICNISATVREGKEIYKKPQVLQLEIPFKLVNSELCNNGEVLGDTCTPGEALGAKIERSEKDFRVRAELMGKISSFIPKLQKVCDLRSTLNQGTNGALLLSMIANGVAINTQNVKVGDISFTMLLRMSNLDACFSGAGSSSGGGSGFPGVTGSIDPTNIQNSMNSQGWMQSITQMFRDQQMRQNIASKCKGMVGKACDFLSCTKTDDTTKVTKSLIKENYDSLTGMDTAGDTQTGLPDLFGKGTNFADESKDMLTANINVPDVSKSIVMAAATQCWPAVYYNLEKYRQVECNYLYCLKMAAYTGTDVSACDQAKKTQYCTMIVGEIFELPYINAVTNIAENAADYVSNFLPLAAASALKRVMCPSDISNGDVFENSRITLPQTVPQQTYRIYMCHVPLQIARFADTQRRSSGAGDSFRYPTLPDMCQYAKCVGEENCAYEPSFFDDINKIKLPVRNNSLTAQQKIDQENAKQVAETNKNLNALERIAFLETLKDKGTLSETQQKEYDELVADARAVGYLPSDFDKIPQETTSAITLTETQLAQKKEDAKKLVGEISSSQGLDYPSDYFTFNELDAKHLEDLKTDITTYTSQVNELKTQLKQLESTDPLNGIDPGLYNLWKQDPSTLDANSERLFNEYANKVNEHNADIALTKENIGAYEKMASDSEAIKTYLEKCKDISDLETKLEGTKSQADLEKNNIQAIYNAQKKYYECIKTSGNANKCADEVFKSPNSVADQKAIQWHAALTMSEDDYKKLDLNGQLEIDKSRQEAYAELKKLNNLVTPEVYAGRDPNLPIDPTGKDSTTINDLLKRRESLLRDVGLCDEIEETIKVDCKSLSNEVMTDTGGGEGMTNYINSQIDKQSAELIKHMQDIEKAKRAYQGAETVGNGIFIGLQYLNAQHMIDWFFTDYWTEKMGLDVSDILDPEKWKDSLCNPTNRVQIGGTSSENNVVSCEGGFCQPVLTYAMERTDLQYPNGTKYYIYTSVYYISGGDLRGRNVTYNIYFTGSGATVYGFRDNKQINPFEIVQKKKIFKAKIEFDTVCFKFSEPFPVGNALSGATEYCRPITGNEFDNGSPWVSEEEQKKAETYLDEYDENGQRLTSSSATTSTSDSRPLGIFE